MHDAAVALGAHQQACNLFERQVRGAVGRAVGDAVRPRGESRRYRGDLRAARLGARGDRLGAALSAGAILAQALQVLLNIAEHRCTAGGLGLQPTDQLVALVERTADVLNARAHLLLGAFEAFDRAVARPEVTFQRADAILGGKQIGTQRLGAAAGDGDLLIQGAHHVAEFLGLGAQGRDAVPRS